MFARAGSTWTQQRILQPGDKATGDFFGSAVALSMDGHTALIGAATKSDDGKNSNSDAYLFGLAGIRWAQQQKLQPGDSAGDDGFGHAVALSADGSTALVGAAAGLLLECVSQVACTLAVDFLRVTCGELRARQA